MDAYQWTNSETEKSNSLSSFGQNALKCGNEDDVGVEKSIQADPALSCQLFNYLMNVAGVC